MVSLISEVAGQVVVMESIVAEALILIIIAMGVIHREILVSESARIRLKENLGKLRGVVLICLISLYVYILGEVADLAVSLNILPKNYYGVHEIAEISHLGLLIIGFSRGLQILVILKGSRR